ncbi:MAG TPA: phosphomannose isomerase type II C-terminal cupin domain [Elusimicrobiota bacterium]|jgi:mannose-6-phosphate isomerase|nr:phosphomannose isomerase type II C-terminal cupin domain [Elusimicrobiota bacterium]
MQDPHPFAKSHEAPWGSWEVLLTEPGHQVKRIHVKAGKRLSYQTHAKRSEHWFVVQGSGLAVLGGKDIPLSAGQSLDVPVGAPHRMGNPGNSELIFIEVQRGDYLGEDDIVRLDDDFGRVR